MAKEIKENKKELVFIDTLLRDIILFAECDEEDAIIFVMNFLKKIEDKGLKISGKNKKEKK